MAVHEILASFQIFLLHFKEDPILQCALGWNLFRAWAHMSSAVKSLMHSLFPDTWKLMGLVPP